MKLQIDGTNTLNKGAELMLYAALEQIEPRYPQADIYYNAFGAGYKEVKTSLNLKGFLRLRYGFYPGIILSKLKLPYSYFTNFYPSKKIDVLLDASGFRLGDQWNRSKGYIAILESYYKELKAKGTKIILLPQALGPFVTDTGRETAKVLNKYADLIIARESISYQYLIDAHVDPAKMLLAPDFTNIVKGTVPQKYEDVKGKVCIIPNKKMLTHTSLGEGKYIEFLRLTIETVKEAGFDVFILNHEGEGDMEICNILNNLFNNSLQIVSGLNAKDVKGVIGLSYLTFSSRYHGVASALSQSVPCLATSWSHKYQLLFKDYGLDNQVIDIDADAEVIKQKVLFYLDRENNRKMRETLMIKKEALKELTKNMWDQVWKLVG